MSCNSFIKKLNATTMYLLASLIVWTLNFSILSSILLLLLLAIVHSVMYTHSQSLCANLFLQGSDKHHDDPASSRHHPDRVKVHLPHQRLTWLQRSERKRYLWSLSSHIHKPNHKKLYADLMKEVLQCTLLSIVCIYCTVIHVIVLLTFYELEVYSNANF